MAQSAEPALRKPLRLWPGVLAAALLVLVKFVVPLVVPGTGGVAMLGGLAGALAVLVWWLFFSRAPWPERVGAIVLMAVASFATWPILHESIRNGMMGMMFGVYVIPILGLALVVWAVASRRLTGGPRRASMLAAALLACGVFALLRTDGMTGDADSEFEWRWTPTAEQRLLAQARLEPVLLPSAPAAEETPAPQGSGQAGESPSVPASPPAVATTLEKAVPAPAVERPTESPADPTGVRAPAEWPGFRGPRRDGIIRGVRVETDWSTSPPAELWRAPIGPGWSSFAVSGDFVFTQEQRGDEEVVSCYRLSTGKPVWRHSDPVRFWESNGGAGPRATPTVHGGRVYTLGATGIVNALDARSGSVAWSRNAAADTGAELPGWGFSGSPLMVDDSVFVAASGRLAAYDAATGNPRWTRPTVGGGYSSPHLATLDGVAQIVLSSGGGVTSVSPADGSVLWEYKWQPGASIVQPALIDNGDVLISGADPMGGTGMRRLAVVHTDGWKVDERWTSRGLKPYFNDFVVHEGHVFGFDGSILSCIDLENGERNWKGGRYGHGQMVLLADQDVLLVLSEEGEVALVSATPDKFTELARFKAMEGKTWNHPVLVGNILLVRNGEEMAAYRLPVAGR
ncbi:MAG TPA: PQQ-binding-like beta-propeller repeat protein [Vicinamibacterales bacterium]|nr:PQQ-binding-like beta-propeller repeat protein [Vicinamibacterales bacterium]